jgi:hypothetical protein
MNKLIFLFLLVPSISLASPLDILDANGNFDGRFGRNSSEEGDTSEISFDMTQGVRLVGAPWIEPYLGFSKYQQLDVVNTEWLSMGIRNKTFLPPFTFGLEYRSVVEPIDSPNPHIIVGYVSAYKEWNLKKAVGEQ